MQPIFSKTWSFLKRIGFLFLATYFFFLIMDIFNVAEIEIFPHFVSTLIQPYNSFWGKTTSWAGKYIFHLSYPIKAKINGSGDTTYNYVQQFLWMVFAGITAIVWTFLERNRAGYARLSYRMRIVIRYYLALVLLMYGFYKVFYEQFPAPSLHRLVQPFGTSSPMGLAWTFVGYSKAYNLYLGGSEVLAGCFLLFKRTTLFGSLIAMTIMINVAVMNFCYDIPVKLFSMNIILMAFYLAAYDIERIVNVFFLHKEMPAAFRPFYKSGPKTIAQRSLKALAILFILYATLWTSFKMQNEWGPAVPKPPLYGIYNVDAFLLKGDTLPPLTTDTLRWKQIVISWPGLINIRAMNDSSRWMLLKIDSTKKTAVIIDRKDTLHRSTFSYFQTDKERLTFKGTINNESATITMNRYDENRFLLMNRGFHWINEYPLNR